jgi:hypothetical protein
MNMNKRIIIETVVGAYFLEGGDLMHAPVSMAGDIVMSDASVVGPDILGDERLPCADLHIALTHLETILAGQEFNHA